MIIIFPTLLKRKDDYFFGLWKSSIRTTKAAKATVKVIASYTDMINPFQESDHQKPLASPLCSGLATIFFTLLLKNINHFPKIITFFNLSDDSGF
ncbi:hypothetical protein HMPREF0556_10047 [Listeria grayi DSM 20601]|uniref:Uncharacterized protein n=1 Tax=Listeria grayi DSM 20601 TaxID=525367 RepID=D7UU72_LISGR|nr:hypothetical protein HMPREF0556_10047 [Listeria grayi DSM 20601]